MFFITTHCHSWGLKWECMIFPHASWQINILLTFIYIEHSKVRFFLQRTFKSKIFLQQYQHASIPRIARFECTKHVIPFIQDWSALPSSTFWRTMLQQCCKHFDEICYPPQPVTAHQWRFCYRFLHISKCTKKNNVLWLLLFEPMN